MDDNLDNGAFLGSLKRNNDKIRDDRANAIVEDAQLMYRRKVEDLSLLLKRLKRDQENMLDLSPVDANSLVLASDFDAQQYVNKDLEMAVKIRNLEIKLDLAAKRYKYLFGQDLNIL